MNKETTKILTGRIYRKKKKVNEKNFKIAILSCYVLKNKIFWENKHTAMVVETIMTITKCFKKQILRKQS